MTYQALTYSRNKKAFIACFKEQAIAYSNGEKRTYSINADGEIFQVYTPCTATAHINNTFRGVRT